MAHWIIWLIAAGVFLVAELMTIALISIWFVPAALITAVFSLFVRSFAIQFIVFLALSVVFFALFGRVYKNKIKPKDATADTINNIVGKNGICTEDTDSVSGQVKIGDVYWKAVSDDKIQKGDIIKVISVQGTVIKVIKN